MNKEIETMEVIASVKNEKEEYVLFEGRAGDGSIVDYTISYYLKGNYVCADETFNNLNDARYRLSEHELSLSFS